MSKPLVYDLPTRLFHWVFAGLFVAIYGISNLIDDESSLFAYHMLLGMVMVVAVCMRLAWGVAGSRTARFGSFILHPKALLIYMKGIVMGGNARKLGRNPASSWAALIMMSLALGLALTGYWMATGQASHDVEEIHELMANGFLVVVLLHVGGIILHTLRHKDALGLSMVSGRKMPVDGEEGIASARPLVALLMAVGLISSVLWVFSHYQADTQQIVLFGQTWELGEQGREGNESLGKTDKAGYEKEHEEEEE